MDRRTEPMCETSEAGERLIFQDELFNIQFDVGRRLMEVFGYQEISHIVFRLKTTRHEIDNVINGQSLPSTELLLGISKVTGASIDWLLTGIGPKFRPVDQPIENVGTRPASRYVVEMSVAADRAM